jgi:hypothetical protein
MIGIKLKQKKILILFDFTLFLNIFQKILNENRYLRINKVF